MQLNNHFKYYYNYLEKKYCIKYWIIQHVNCWILGQKFPTLFLEDFQQYTLSPLSDTPVQVLDCSTNELLTDKLVTNWLELTMPKKLVCFTENTQNGILNKSFKLLWIKPSFCTVYRTHRKLKNEISLTLTCTKKLK